MENIYLVGFMGSGKSSVGRALSLRLGLNSKVFPKVFPKGFIDTDLLIQKQASKSIDLIFKEKGEVGFRRLERSVIAKVSRLSKRVIALGGGSLEDSRNLETAKKSGFLIYLRTNPETVFLRLRHDRKPRPLLQGLSVQERQSKIKSLLRSRRAAYAQADYTVSTDGLTVAQVVEKIFRSRKFRSFYLRGKSS